MAAQETPHLITNGQENLEIDPLFVNSANPIGGDNCWLTEDDGLRLSPASPLINAGTADDAPSTDITGVAHFLDPELGPYEFINHSGLISAPVKQEVSVSPNPAQDFILIRGFSKTAGFRLFNALGQEIKSFRVIENQSDIRHLPAGIYLLEIESGDEISTLRFVKE
ncbi:MAG: T9SS type A sorting domain-containing protein [Bacteroidota bacterium]